MHRTGALVYLLFFVSAFYFLFLQSLGKLVQVFWTGLATIWLKAGDGIFTKTF